MNEILGNLAFDFRSAKDDNERQWLADLYKIEVERLINKGGWTDCPAPEDTLPDKWMPAAFNKHWTI